MSYSTARRPLSLLARARPASSSSIRYVWNSFSYRRRSDDTTGTIAGLEEVSNEAQTRLSSVESEGRPVADGAPSKPETNTSSTESIRRIAEAALEGAHSSTSDLTVPAPLSDPAGDQAPQDSPPSGTPSQEGIPDELQVASRLSPSSTNANLSNTTERGPNPGSTFGYPHLVIYPAVYPAVELYPSAPPAFDATCHIARPTSHVNDQSRIDGSSSAHHVPLNDQSAPAQPYTPSSTSPLPFPGLLSPTEMMFNIYDSDVEHGTGFSFESRMSAASNLHGHDLPSLRLSPALTGLIDASAPDREVSDWSGEYPHCRSSR